VLYRFNQAEVDMLMDLALANAVRCAAEYDHLGRALADRQDLLIAARIVAELHEPSPGAPMFPDPPANGLNLSMLPDDDPADPRCVHGVKRSSPCEACAHPSPARAFEVSPEERAALDEALANRNAQLTPEFARRHDPAKTWDDDIR
jgi:hypothetical protein